jgi:hypothetical protein
VAAKPAYKIADDEFIEGIGCEFAERYGFGRLNIGGAEIVAATGISRQA